MLSVIRVSMLIILHSVLSVIGHLICGNNFNWLLNLNLTYEALWTGVRSALLISVLGKLSWFRLSSQITIVLLMWEWMGLFLRKNNLLRCWDWPWCYHIISIAKTASKKIGALISFRKFISPAVLCISINPPYAHVSNTAVTSGLVPLVATWNCQTSYKNEYAGL